MQPVDQKVSIGFVPPATLDLGKTERGVKRRREEEAVSECRSRYLLNFLAVCRILIQKDIDDSPLLGKMLYFPKLRNERTTDGLSRLSWKSIEIVSKQRAKPGQIDPEASFFKGLGFIHELFHAYYNTKVTQFDIRFGENPISKQNEITIKDNFWEIFREGLVLHFQKFYSKYQANTLVEGRSLSLGRDSSQVMERLASFGISGKELSRVYGRLAMTGDVPEVVSSIFKQLSLPEHPALVDRKTRGFKRLNQISDPQILSAIATLFGHGSEALNIRSEFLEVANGDKKPDEAFCTFLSFLKFQYLSNDSNDPMSQRIYDVINNFLREGGHRQMSEQSLRVAQLYFAQRNVVD